MYISPRSKILQHPERLAIIKRGETPPPINIEIDLSNRCSLGCEWCHFAYTHTRGPLKGSEGPTGKISGGDLMDHTLIRRVIPELRLAGALSVTWTGGGEPTLHPHFNEIVRYSSIFIKQGVYTNGAHIDAERAATLREAMSFVYVSLDAHSAESYKQAKRVDRFDQVLDGVRRLVSARGSAVVGLGFLLTEQNWIHHKEMVDLSRDLGVAYCQFRPTIHYDQDSPSQLVARPYWINHALRQLENYVGVPGVEIDVARFRRYANWTGHGYKTCHWSTLQTVITPNGMVWTCVNKREHPGALLGDLNETSFVNLWRRHTAAPVDHDCRVLCRGDVANQTLDTLMSDQPHSEFP